MKTFRENIIYLSTDVVNRFGRENSVTLFAVRFVITDYS